MISPLQACQVKNTSAFGEFTAQPSFVKRVRRLYFINTKRPSYFTVVI